MKPYKVVVFEGPAGSGKSYLMREFSDVYQLGYEQPESQLPELYLGQELPEIDRPRAYIGNLGYYHSQLKDYRSSLNMLLAGVNRVSLVDRWLISQVIYDHIRLGHNELRPGILEASVVSGLKSLGSALAESRTRQGLKPESRPPTIHILFVILAGSPGSVYHTRSFAEANGREYPYDAQTEVQLYRHAASILRAWASYTPVELNGVSFHVGVSAHYMTNLLARSTQVTESILSFISGPRP